MGGGDGGHKGKQKLVNKERSGTEIHWGIRVGKIETGIDGSKWEGEPEGDPCLLRWYF